MSFLHYGCGIMINFNSYLLNQRFNLLESFFSLSLDNFNLPLDHFLHLMLLTGTQWGLNQEPLGSFIIVVIHAYMVSGGMRHLALPVRVQFGHSLDCLQLIKFRVHVLDKTLDDFDPFNYFILEYPKSVLNGLIVTGVSSVSLLVPRHHSIHCQVFIDGLMKSCAHLVPGVECVKAAR